MVRIDTVYQRVLALANKEQRGYITPQEFNLFADQAQVEILEQYFYDINQFGRMHGNNTEYSDMLNLLDEKLGVLKNTQNLGAILGSSFGLASDVYKLGSVFNEGVELDMVNQNELRRLESGLITKPKWSSAIKSGVYIIEDSKVKLYPISTTAWSNVGYTYIRKLKTPYWGYVVVDGNAMYNPNASVDFALHASEEAELVNRILSLAGVSIKQPDLVQTATQFEQLKQNSEKR